MATEVRIVGTRTFAAEVVDYARDAGFTVVELVEPHDADRIGTTVHGLPVRSLNDPPAAAATVVVAEGSIPLAAGELDRREAVARALNAGWEPRSLIHPRAHIAPTASVGAGTLLGPGVVVGAYSEIGEHAVLGRGTLVGHHTKIGPYCTLGPGANVAGAVRVESDAFLGMGAMIRDHVVVGTGAVVAMGAAAVGDVPPGATVMGLPARLRGSARSRSARENGEESPAG
jgi:acetyltransferase EpsM